MSEHALQSFFWPQSIAVLGALALFDLAPMRVLGQVPTQGQTQLPGGLPAGMTPDQLAPK